MTKFLETVLLLLNKKGVSKNKMLTDLNLGKNSFANWENRETIPGGDTLSKIADYFGVTTDYLLGRTDKPTMDIEIKNNTTGLSEHEKNLIKAYRKQPEMQEAVNRLLNIEVEDKPIKVLRIARSDDNHEPEIVEMSAERLQRLRNAPFTDEDL